MVEAFWGRGEITMKQNNIPLELDARIFDIADIRTVITAGENDVGKMGYFANSIHLFKNLEGLDGIKYGKLMYLSDLDHGGDKSDKCFVCDNHWAYRYFIPEDALKPIEKKKKYRPYTLYEWINFHKIGEVIHFRHKSINMAFHHMYMGYDVVTDTIDAGTGRISMGNANYAFDYLFQYYEIEVGGEWLPFGMKVEE